MLTDRVPFRPLPPGGFAPPDPPTRFRLRQGYGETSPKLEERRRALAGAPRSPRRSRGSLASLVRLYAWSSMLTKVILCAFLGLATPPVATAALAAPQVPAAAPAPAQRQMVRVFLDCDRCDEDYLRKEVTFVDYVRNREDADVHVLVTVQETGGGGAQWTLKFIGLGAFQAIGSDAHLQLAGDRDVRRGPRRFRRGLQTRTRALRRDDADGGSAAGHVQEDRRRRGQRRRRRTRGTTGSSGSGSTATSTARNRRRDARFADRFRQSHDRRLAHRRSTRAPTTATPSSSSEEEEDGDRSRRS